MKEKLRQRIAGYFISDGGDFLKRYELLAENFSHIGNRSKLAIDLLFSYECSLKALIFLESTENEKKTYAKIKTCSHHICKLLNHVDTAPINDISNYIKETNLDKLSVGCRYQLEANRQFRENGVLADKYYSTIACPKWIEEVYQNTNELHDYVRSKMAPIQSVDLEDIDIQEELDEWKRISEIDK